MHKSTYRYPPWWLPPNWDWDKSAENNAKCKINLIDIRRFHINKLLIALIIWTSPTSKVLTSMHSICEDSTPPYQSGSRWQKPCILCAFCVQVQILRPPHWLTGWRREFQLLPFSLHDVNREQFKATRGGLNADFHISCWLPLVALTIFAEPSQPYGPGIWWSPLTFCMW